jgi:N utilization substance protein A
VLSRTHTGLLTKLFEMEVPEIYEGIVRIEACAREPGHRAKIAVSSIDPDVDPVGACVGLKGSRVQAVVNECRGEAVDIIPWHPDTARFVVHAIAPASVVRVYIDEGRHAMELIVPDEHLAKAIGRRGQNVRLASQLVGWRLDITAESKHRAQIDSAYDELSRITGLDDERIEHLVRQGFLTAQEIADLDASELSQLVDLTDEQAQAIVDEADQVVERLIMEEADRRKRVPGDGDDEALPAEV